MFFFWGEFKIYSFKINSNYIKWFRHLVFKNELKYWTIIFTDYLKLYTKHYP